MVSSLGSNASIPELVKMTHVIDKYLSADPTVSTEKWLMGYFWHLRKNFRTQFYLIGKTAKYVFNNTWH